MDRFELSLHFAAALVALTLLGGAPSSVHAEGHGEAAAEGGAAKESGGESEGAKKSKDKDTDISGGRFEGDPVYVHLQPLVLPIINDNGAEQLVTLLIDLQVKDLDVADDFHMKMPRLRDAVMRSLYGGLGQGSLRRGHLVDIDKIKTKLAATLSETFGPDKVHEVLIQAVAQRML